MYCIKKAMYDNRNDILYVHFSNYCDGASYSDEYSGVLIQRDMNTDEITGITIFYPKKDSDLRKKDLDELGIKIDFLPLVV